MLTGVVAGLLGAGCDPAGAAALGVWLHGRAAELALPGHARRSLLASDLLGSIGEALDTLETFPEPPTI